MIDLHSCPKGYSQDQDKAIAPESTVQNVKKILASLNISILDKTERIDVGRLGIPVFLSVCGHDAKSIMPTRKQMGKGVSPAQAEASAIMELMERYGFFTYFATLTEATYATWSEAQEKFGTQLISINEVVKACHDTISAENAMCIMNLRKWCFMPALHMQTKEITYLPVDLFRQLGEFNGSSAGNTHVESILQGTAELIERHVCAIIDKTHPTLPTISLADAAAANPHLAQLINTFKQNGIILILKDFSLSMPLPTVGAIAIDFSTFPHTSEIVFTAGTATTPAKAAIRAITEVAQLAGDFCTSACYEASGLPKLDSWEQANWLLQGNEVPLHSLPSISHEDMLDELEQLARELSCLDYSLYSISTTNPQTKIPTHYNIIPGFQFRERDNNASLGLFVGRMLAEQEDKETAVHGLNTLAQIYPQGHFIPFFYGLIAMREENFEDAIAFFSQAETLQPDKESKALAAFYHGYCFTLLQNWESAQSPLSRAVALCPDMKEYRNLCGVCHFKMQQYAEAIQEFSYIIIHLDKGSVMDLQNLGVCHKYAGNKQEAIRFLRAALSIDPSLPAANQHLQELL